MNNLFSLSLNIRKNVKNKKQSNFINTSQAVFYLYVTAVHF